jgi:hypothetical protein
MPTIYVDLIFVNEYTLPKVFSLSTSMPRPTPALRGRKPKSAQRVLAETRHLLLDIEAPLRDATHYVQALHFIGSGLTAEYDDAGEPIAAVASAAAERLETVRAIWDRIFEAGRRGRSARRKRRTSR